MLLLIKNVKHKIIFKKKKYINKEMYKKLFSVNSIHFLYSTNYLKCFIEI